MSSYFKTEQQAIAHLRKAFPDQDTDRLFTLIKADHVEEITSAGATSGLPWWNGIDDDDLSSWVRDLTT